MSPVRIAAAWRPLLSRARIRLTGADRQTWLHSICTQDIKHLRPGQGTVSTCINDIGRLMFDFRVWVGVDAVYIDVESSVRTKAYEWLDRFLIVEDVELTDITDSMAAIEVAGPQAHAALTRLFPDVTTVPYSLLAVENTLILGSDGTGESTFQVWTATDHPIELALPQYSDSEWNTLRIEAGYPVYGIDMDEDNNPLEAGLNRSVSLDKGCYTGQEVMARLTFRNGPVRHLVGFKSDRLLPAGTTLWAGDKEVGRITSSVESPALVRPIAMGYVRREFKDPGSKLTVHPDISVEVAALPWVGGQRASDEAFQREIATMSWAPWA